MFHSTKLELELDCARYDRTAEAKATDPASIGGQNGHLMISQNPQAIPYRSSGLSASMRLGEYRIGDAPPITGEGEASAFWIGLGQSRANLRFRVTFQCLPAGFSLLVRHVGHE